MDSMRRVADVQPLLLILEAVHYGLQYIACLRVSIHMWILLQDGAKQIWAQLGGISLPVHLLPQDDVLGTVGRLGGESKLGNPEVITCGVPPLCGVGLISPTSQLRVEWCGPAGLNQQHLSQHLRQL